MSKQLDELRQQLMHEELLQGISTGEVAGFINNIPIKKMMDQALFLKEELIPKVKKKQGDKSADAEFFLEVYRSLLWGCVLVDRYEALERRHLSLKVTNMVTREHLQLLEREVDKRDMLEEILLTDSIRSISKGIRLRAEELLKQTKPK